MLKEYYSVIPPCLHTVSLFHARGWLLMSALCYLSAVFASVWCPPYLLLNVGWHLLSFPFAGVVSSAHLSPPPACHPCHFVCRCLRFVWVCTFSFCLLRASTSPVTFSMASIGGDNKWWHRPADETSDRCKCRSTDVCFKNPIWACSNIILTSQIYLLAALIM